MADRFVSLPMTWSDRERRDAKGHIFRLISVITLVPFNIKRNKLVPVTHVGRGVFLAG